MQMLYLLVLVVSATLSAIAAADKKVVCYFTNWAWYRNGKGKFLPENIDPHKCTHINYAFAILDPNTLRIKVHDPWADIDNHFFTKVTSLKSQNSNLKVLLAIGGWTDSAGDKYSRLVAKKSNRREFIRHVIPFLKKYNFDGLDLDWEYPNCWQGDCNKSPNDVANFASLVKELKTQFRKQKPALLLSAAVSASVYTIDNAYDVPTISSFLDHINIMAYDFYGAWGGEIGHHAALYKPNSDSNPLLNVDAAVKYWVRKGAPKNKLIVGVPFYGRSFTLSDSGQNQLGSLTTGPGQNGEFTGESGFLAYYEICERVKQGGWTKLRDSEAGPYAFNGNQWVGYDDPQAITKKAKYVKDNGYGGIMIWDITLDDFTGSCCSVKNPLLSAIQYGLNNQGPAPNAMGCE